MRKATSGDFLCIWYGWNRLFKFFSIGTIYLILRHITSLKGSSRTSCEVRKSQVGKTTIFIATNLIYVSSNIACVKLTYRTTVCTL